MSEVFIVIQATRAYEGIEERIYGVYATYALADAAVKRAKAAWRMGQHDWHIEEWKVK